MTIADKAVLVTGANRGIWQALVDEALSRRATQVSASTRQPLTHPDGPVTPLTLDVTNPAQIQTAAAPEASRNVFRREGEYWTVVFDGSVVRLKDTKGLRHLARLLAHPGREFHATDLQAAQSRPSPAAVAPGGRASGGELAVRPDLGDAGVLLDATAKAAYRVRLAELRAELEEAEGFNDPARAAKARQETEFLVAELARAVGLGGRDRRAASHAERARLNVTRAIRAAVANLARANPALGRHLSSTVRTGRYCAYLPDPRAPIAWERWPGPSAPEEGGYAGDQTGQESRSAGPGAAASVTVMDLTIHASFLPHDDPDAALAFWRDSLGFEVRNDAGYGGLRWITVGPAGQPGTSIVLEPPSPPGCGRTEEERRAIVEMMAKGTYAGVNLATKDLDGVFARLQASGAEVVQEPTEQPYGVRDCAVRDPAGNLIRIQELTGAQLASLTTRRDRQPAQWWPPRLTLRPETHRSSSLERLAGKCCPGKDSRG